MLTAMTSQRAALRRSDDVVETRRAASFDGPIRGGAPGLQTIVARFGRGRFNLMTVFPLLFKRDNRPHAPNF